MINAISIDLEDWFCANNFSELIPQKDWDKCELRVGRSLVRIIDLLEQHNTLATFFVLGWIAERIPDLVLRIEAAGHEIAVHGYRHLLLTQVTPEEFEADLKRGLDTLRHIGVKKPVIGFRAPSFTITRNTMWALDILERFNIKYDSSVFPVGFHPDYGIPDAPLVPYGISKNLVELPMSCAEVLGRRIPCSGGAYFRIFPYFIFKYLVRSCHRSGRGIVFYLHPWELDPDQPRISLPLTKRLRHYYGLSGTERKLRNLLSDFKFTTIKKTLGL